MLIEFVVKNNSAINKEVKLVFQKGRYAFNEYMIVDGIVNPAIVIGKNSIGKSSVLKSFINIIDIFKSDLNSETLYAIKNAFSSDLESEYKLKIKLNEKIYDYTITLGFDSMESIFTNKIVSEQLLIDGKLVVNRDDIELDDNKSIVRHFGTKKSNDEIAIMYEYLSKIVFIDSKGEVFNSSSNMYKLIVKKYDDYIDSIRELEDIPIFKFKLEESISTGMPLLIFGSKM